MKCSVWDEKGSDGDANKYQKLEEPEPDKIVNDKIKQIKFI